MLSEWLEKSLIQILELEGLRHIAKYDKLFDLVTNASKKETDRFFSISSLKFREGDNIINNLMKKLSNIHVIS